MAKKKPKRASKKRPQKRAPKPALIQRPASWWREPLTKRQREGIPEDELAITREQERGWKVERYKEMIRSLRRVTAGFEASDGFPLTTNQLIRIPPAKLRKLEDAYRRLQNVTSHPYVEARPRTKEQLKNVRLQAAQVFKGQKVYFLHPETTEGTKVRFRKGRVILETTAGTVKRFEGTYYFPRKPRKWDDVKRYTAQIQREGMRDGSYRLMTSIYGAAGSLTDRDAMQEALDSFWSTYKDGFAEFITGWKWYGTSWEIARRKVKREKTTAERFKEVRAFQRYKKQRQVLERLGKAKRCKKCKRKRCVCKAPEFK